MIVAPRLRQCVVYVFIGVLLLDAIELRFTAIAATSLLDLSFDPQPNSSGLFSARAGRNAIAIQRDGKILVSGIYSDSNAVARRAIIRLDPDGSLDTTFRGPTQFIDESNQRFLIVQPDNKILVGGTFAAIAGSTFNGIARLLPDGTLDETFNPNPGIEPAGCCPQPYAIAFQSNGDIVVSGYFSKVNGLDRRGLARLHSDGSLDPTFDPIEPGSASAVFSIAIQSDDGILVGGGFTLRGEKSSRRIARLLADGSVDLTFNPSDFDSITAGSVRVIVLQPDGQLLVTAVAAVGPQARSLFRLREDGSFDTSFDAGILSPAAIAVRPDGRLLIAGGFYELQTWGGYGLVQLLPDGNWDAGFVSAVDKTGEQKPELFWPEIEFVALQPDGKAIIAGPFDNIEGVPRPGLARIQFVPTNHLSQFFFGFGWGNGM